MKLIIDIGNTFIKTAVFQEDKIVYENSVSDFAPKIFEEIFLNFSVKSCIISNVRENIYPIIDFLASKTTVFVLNHKTALPFTNKYATPHTLGRDRMAGIAAASKIFPNKNVLVIDAGTSITYDLINNNNEYLGGGISPGLKMRFKALNEFTAKLPLINFNGDELPALIGNNTENSILSGVIFGFVKEIEGIISEYKSTHNPLEIIVTGGDHKYFDKLLKYKTFAAPNLILEGLKGILDFNEEN
jgi:type III pantothenate kinase